MKTRFFFLIISLFVLGSTVVHAEQTDSRKTEFEDPSGLLGRNATLQDFILGSSEDLNPAGVLGDNVSNPSQHDEVNLDVNDPKTLLLLLFGELSPRQIEQVIDQLSDLSAADPTDEPAVNDLFIEMLENFEQAAKPPTKGDSKSNSFGYSCNSQVEFVNFCTAIGGKSGLEDGNSGPVAYCQCPTKKVYYSRRLSCISAATACLK